jgi:hypothetical protein
LISPAEDNSRAKTAESLQVTFSKVFLDGRLMTSAQERSNLAFKMFLAGDLMQKTQSRNIGFLDAAKEADLEIDDDLLEGGSNMSQKGQLRLKEVRKAKVHLDQVLSEPMKTQRFSKFLSTNSVPSCRLKSNLSQRNLCKQRRGKKEVIKNKSTSY